METQQFIRLEFLVPIGVAREVDEVAELAGLSRAAVLRMAVKVLLDRRHKLLGELRAISGGLVSLRAKRIAVTLDDDAPAPAPNGGGG
jgi:hypothetical protein